MNSINLTGNLTKDIEIKQSNAGKTVATFDIAVKRPYSNETDFFHCVAWEQKAEYLSKYARKGSKIGVTGHLIARKWQDKNGSNRITYEVNCDSVEAHTNAPQSTETYNPYNSTSSAEIDMKDIRTDDPLPF